MFRPVLLAALVAAAPFAYAQTTTSTTGGALGSSGLGASGPMSVNPGASTTPPSALGNVSPTPSLGTPSIPTTGGFAPPNTTLPGTATTPGLSTLPGITPQPGSAAAGGTAATGGSAPSRFCSPGSIVNPC